MKRFLNLIVYILSVHLSALIITGLFRGVLFISSYHQLTAEALSDKSLSLIAFIHGVWFDNVIGCYILLLPLTVAVACGLCNCYGKALFRFFTIFFGVFYGLVYLISAADIPLIPVYLPYDPTCKLLAVSESVSRKVRFNFFVISLYRELILLLLSTFMLFNTSVKIYRAKS